MQSVIQFVFAPAPSMRPSIMAINYSEGGGLISFIVFNEVFRM